MAVYPAQAGQVAAMRARQAQGGTEPPSPSQQVLEEILGRLAQPVAPPPEPEPLSVGRRIQLALTSLGNPQGFRDLVLPELVKRDPEYRARQAQEAQGLDMDRLTRLHGILAGQEDAAAIMDEKRAAAEAKAKKMTDTAGLFLEQSVPVIEGINEAIAALEKSAAEFPEDADLARLLKTQLGKFNSVAAVAAQRLQEGESVEEADIEILKSALNDIDAAYRQVITARTGAVRAERGLESREGIAAANQESQNQRQDVRFLQQQELLSQTLKAQAERQIAGFDFRMEQERMRQRRTQRIAHQRSKIEQMIPFEDDVAQAISLVEEGVGGPGVTLLGLRPKLTYTAKQTELDMILSKLNAKTRHDISGAAVTESEARRLRPFLPEISDTKGQMLIKLRGYQKELEQIIAARAAAFNWTQLDVDTIRDIVKGNIDPGVFDELTFDGSGVDSQTPPPPPDRVPTGLELD